METLITKLSFLVFFGLLRNAMGEKRCLFHYGKCVEYCPRDMHPYHTRCDVETLSQKTCASPEVYVLGLTCGWSRCDCNGDLVLSEYQGCIPEADCVSECPEDMHRVDSQCRLTFSQKTCQNPVAHSLGVICGWSRCDCDIPYTGHCPMLKFRYGKCYGDNTRQILREIRSKGLFKMNYSKPLEYRPGDNYEINNMPRRDRPQEYVYDGLRHRQPAYMTGYTGYVPGMHFRYGKSYGRAADDCMTDFANHQRELRRKADYNKTYTRSRSAPKMETIHSRDEIRRELNKFREINKYKENTISPEFPPIAGYTGHIPRIKGSEASLSQRYHCAAKRGLELIRMEKDQRNELQKAAADVRHVLREKEKKYSYCNWG